MQLKIGRTASFRLQIGFDWTLVLASIWFVGGLLLDGWAHAHIDLEGEGVFTPFHIVLYSGFLAVLGVVLGPPLRHRWLTHTWTAAVPAGHRSTVAGVAVFGVGAVLDLTWHRFFGIEQDLQAILSPTHLVLALGAALIILGPFRAVRARPEAAGWREYGPALVSFTLFLTIVEFFTQWAVGLHFAAADAPALRHAALSAQDIELLGFLQLTHDLLVVQFFGAMFAGLAIFLSRRLPVPFGAVTAMFTASAVLLAVSRGDSLLASTAVIILPSLCAGLLTDLLRTSPALSSKPTTRVIALGAAVPLAYWFPYFAISVTSGGTWWQIHSLIGAPFIGTVCGVMLALLQQQPHAGRSEGASIR